MNNTKISEILKPIEDNQIVQVDDLFRTVVEKLQINKSGCVCLVDKDNRPLGVITDGDVRRFIYNSKGETLASLFSHYAELMANTDFYRGNKEMKIIDCLALLYKNRIGALPIVDRENKLIGIVNIREIIGEIVSSYEKK